MRLCLLSVFVFLILTFANGAKGQDVLFRSTYISVGGVIEAVEQQTLYGFAFDVMKFDTTAKVQLSHLKLPLRSALEQMLHETKFTYTLQGRYIIMVRKPPVKKVPVVVASDSLARTGDIYRLTDPESLSRLPLRKRIDEPVYVFDTTYIEKPKPIATSHYRPPEELLPMRVPHNPKLLLKTNLMYAAGAFTPNIALEYRISGCETVALSVGLNQWNLKPRLEEDKKLVHMVLMPEYRRWLCEPFRGHSIGGHLLYGRYNISTHTIPLLFDRAYRYDGHGFGAGVTYGYLLQLGGVVGLEFSAGLGVVYMKYERFSCKLCSRDGVPVSKLYLGPTRLAVNLTFVLK